MLDFEFDEASGTSFADSSGYGNNGTAGGGVAAGSTGHAGNAASFSGGAVTVSGPTAIPDSPAVSVEAWVQPQAPLNVNRTILTRVGSYSLRQLSTDFSFEVKGTTGALCVARSNGLGIGAGTWYHVAGWYDGVHAYVAVNGAVMNTVGCPNGPVTPTPSATFSVGGIPGSSVTEPYAGAIDEVRVRQGAVSPARARWVSPWTVVSNTGNRVTMTHNLGFTPTSCRAFWTSNPGVTPRRPVPSFQQDCHAAGITAPSWRGLELGWDATSVFFTPYTAGFIFCYYEQNQANWFGANNGNVQVVCEL